MIVSAFSNIKHIKIDGSADGSFRDFVLALLCKAFFVLSLCFIFENKERKSRELIIKLLIYYNLLILLIELKKLEFNLPCLIKKIF